MKTLLFPIQAFFLITAFFIGRSVEISKFYDDFQTCQFKEKTDKQKDIVRRLPFEDSLLYLHGIAFDCYLKKDYK
jgi:hypothetical protein